MFRIRNALFAVPALATFLFCGGFCPAQESPLSNYSSEVDVLLRLKEPDRTMEKVIGLVNRVQPGAGDALKGQQSTALGKLISNPTLTGVDQTRDWYVGVYAQGEEPPALVFAIPALKTEDMVSALGPEMTTKVQDRWVIYTDGDTIPAAERTANAATQLGEAGTKLFTQGDLGIYVNISHLSTVYEKQIELAKDKALESLNQLRFVPQQSGINMQAVIDFYGTLAEGLFQGIEDGQASLASITIHDENIEFHKQVTFADGSASSKFLAENKTDAMPQLLQLPGGSPVYYGFSGALRGLYRFGMKMNASMMQDTDVEKLDQQIHKLDDVNFGPIVATMNLAATDSGALRASSISVAQPIDKIRDFSREAMKTLGQIDNAAFKQTATLQKDAETYGTHHGDIITIQQEFKEGADPAGMQRVMQKFMFGENGIETRNVFLEKEYLSTVGGGQEAMQALIQDAGSKQQNSLVKERERLMKEANVLLFLDLPNLVGNVLRAASLVEGFPLPINGQMIDTMNLKTTYISVAMGSEPNTFKSEMYLPVEQIVGIAKLGVMIAGTARPGF